MGYRFKILIIYLILCGCESPQQGSLPQTTTPPEAPDTTTPPSTQPPTISHTPTRPPTHSAKKADASSPDDNDKPNPHFIKALQKQKFDPTLNQKLDEIDLKTICDFSKEQRILGQKEVNTSSWKKKSIPSLRIPISLKFPKNWKIKKEEGSDEMPEIYRIGNVVQIGRDPRKGVCGMRV